MNNARWPSTRVLFLEPFASVALNGKPLGPILQYLGRKQLRWSSRQKLVNALTRFSGLRDRIRLVAKLVSHIPINGDRIRVLLKDSFDIPRLQLQLFLTSIIASINVVLFVIWAIGMAPGYWILTFLGYGFLMLLAGRCLSHVFERTLNLQIELQKLAAVIGVLEKRPFLRDPAINQVIEPLRTGDERPSLAIKQLARICSGLSIKGHPLIHLMVNLIGPWDMAWTWYLQKVCRRLRQVLPMWIERVATIDATMTLGTFAYLNPDYVWPKQRENPVGKEVGVLTTEVGHPLLAHKQRVRNNFVLLFFNATRVCLHQFRLP